MRILRLNGPNLASLGRRQAEMYGTTTLAREPWRPTSVAAHQVIGNGWRGYLEAIDWLLAAE